VRPGRKTNRSSAKGRSKRLSRKLPGDWKSRRRREVSAQRAKVVAALVRDQGYRVSEMAKYLRRDQDAISGYPLSSLSFLFFLLSRHSRLIGSPPRIGAAPRYSSMYADVDLVMLGRRAKDSRISREIPLGESGHHATPARTSDVQAHRSSDGKRVTDPGHSPRSSSQLRPAAPRCLDEIAGPQTGLADTALPQAFERGRGQ
jgi:hypothetical protein